MGDNRTARCFWSIDNVGPYFVFDNRRWISFTSGWRAYRKSPMSSGRQGVCMGRNGTRHSGTQHTPSWLPVV